MHMDPIIQARRKALREALAWLQARALEMNDPHARQILNSAAYSFGNEMLRGFDAETGKAGLPRSIANGQPVASEHAKAPPKASGPDD